VTIKPSRRAPWNGWYRVQRTCFNWYTIETNDGQTCFKRRQWRSGEQGDLATIGMYGR